LKLLGYPLLLLKTPALLYCSVTGRLTKCAPYNFCVNREEVQPELLFKFSPDLDGENASVRFLTKYIFGPLGSTTSLEEREGPENPFLFVLELLRG